MNSLSAGFCAGLLHGAFTEQDMADYKARWPNPTVQVVDIQRYPAELSGPREAEPSRFYAAVSDSLSLLWVVIPPRTEMEEMISSFSLVVGCCLTLRDYAVVKAPNGCNVLVPLSVSFSQNPLSMIGQPQYDPNLFSLSPGALSFTTAARRGKVARRMEEEDGSSATLLGGSVGELIALRDLVERPECAMRPWWVVVRVVWKGKAYPVQSRHGPTDGVSRRGGGYGARSAGEAGLLRSSRCVQRCVAVDHNGDALLCVFWLNTPSGDGGREVVWTDENQSSRDEFFSVGDCLQLHRGSVLWGAGETVVPMHLQFSERSIVRVLPPHEAASLPQSPSTFFGSLSDGARTVLEILESSSVGDVVAFAARVRYVDSGTYVNTKRGRVLRVVACLEDLGNPNAFIDTTFWGELAEDVRMEPGEVWYITACTVREFMRRKVLGTRSTSVTLRLAAAAAAENEGQTSQPPVTPASEYAHGDAAGAGLHRPSTSGADPQEESQISRVQEDGQADVGVRSSDEMARDAVPKAVVSLREATPTLPAVARFQRVEVPPLGLTCNACEPQATVACDSDTSQVRQRCARCGAPALDSSPAAFLVLSDGLECVMARCLPSVVEWLTESAMIPLADGERGACAAWHGMPILVWLFTEPATQCRTVIRCDHVNLRECSRVLLATITERLSAQGEEESVLACRLAPC